MTLDKFRIMHSTIMEHYQFIEHHLEGIYAAICGKPFVKGLEDVENSNIRRLLQEIKKIEHEGEIFVLSDSDYENLENICQRRNFWCHNCYVDIPFDRKTGLPKKDKDIKLLLEDLRQAETLREDLFQMKSQIMDL